MSNYWVHANIDGRARWHLVVALGEQVLFVETDFSEEMSMEEYREEFPGNQVIELLGPGSCTCDENCDDPCPVHRREDELEDRAICAENELAEICDMIGSGGDGTAKGMAESLLCEMHEYKQDVRRWEWRAQAALQKIADANYDEAEEVLRKEADEYVEVVYGDK